MLQTITFLFISAVVVSVLVNSQYCGDAESETVEVSFFLNGIFNDTGLEIPDEELQLIDIVYFDGLEMTQVKCGTNLKPVETVSKPMVSYSAEQNTSYTLMLIDLDCPRPSSPTKRSHINWMVININGTDVKSGSSKFTYLAPYQPPNSGPHRYVFLAFQQPEMFDKGINVNDNMRSKFQVSEWVEENNLTLIAGNFFNEAPL